MFGDPKTYSDALWEKYMDKFSTQGNQERTLEEQNMRAKSVNFGIVYGRSAATIAEEFRIPGQEAQDWINAWKRRYATAWEFIGSCRAAPMHGRNLITPFGRKRRFQIVSMERLNDIQNQAANFPEQSIASDCVTHTGMAMQEIARQEFGAYLVNTVYDSLIFEMPIDDMDRVFELGALTLRTLREIPKKWGLTLIPFVGDLKIGTRWGSGKKVKIPEHIAERYV
jgi:DNA polymerase-1